MKDEDREQYLAFWKELGPVLKEGFLDPAADHDRLLTLLVGSSTRSEGAEPTSLAEYLDRIEPGQEDIYYLTAENLAAGLHSPHLEAFRQKGIEVLLFTDRVDEVWLSRGGFEFQERKLVSVTRGEVSLGTDEEKKKRKEEVDKSQTEYGDLFFRLRAILQDEIKEVRLSSRLTESPACLVGEEGEISPQLEAMLRQMGQEVPETKRVLELNPEHPLLPRLKQLYDKDAHSEELEESAWLLVDQAVLAEGGKLKDPARLARRISELMKRSL
jgi:molecular chaperone HtpG